MKRGEHFMRLPILNSHISAFAEVTNVCDIIPAPLCRGEAGSRIVGNPECDRSHGLALALFLDRP
jgi:hypothetical protein